MNKLKQQRKRRAAKFCRRIYDILFQESYARGERWHAAYDKMNDDMSGVVSIWARIDVPASCARFVLPNE